MAFSPHSRAAMGGTFKELNDMKLEGEKHIVITAPAKPILGGVGIVDQIRIGLNDRYGRDGIRQLRMNLSEMDPNGDKRFCKGELKDGLALLGIETTDWEIDTLMRHFDRSGDKHLSPKEFMDGVRPSFPKHRQQLVRTAFQWVKNACPSGKVTFGDLERLYDCSDHPAVLAGQRGPDQIREDFVSLWRKAPEEPVTEADFLEFYYDSSSGVDNDIYFELTVRNGWHVGGGVGASACSTVRSVMVNHQSGTKSIVQLKNDFGLGNDTKRILQVVKSQGATDAVGVELDWDPSEI